MIDEAAGTVELKDPAMRLDVGSIGKGYAVEQCARAAEQRGLASASISVGGNIRTIGLRADGTGWSLGVEDPRDQNSQTALYALSLPGGQSLVTSGDYQRYYTVNGEKYHHLIDLQTLYPARYWNSVTVIAPVPSDTVPYPFPRGRTRQTAAKRSPDRIGSVSESRSSALP